MSKPGKSAYPFGLGLLADNPSPIPSYAKAEIAAYDKEMREMRIAERDWRQRLEIIVAALRHFGYNVEISSSVPVFLTPYDWEIECHFECSYSDSDEDEDDDENPYALSKKIRIALKLADQKEAIAAAHKKRLRSRLRKVARAIADATTREGGVEGIVAKLSSSPDLVFKGKIEAAAATSA